MSDDLSRLHVGTLSCTTFTPPASCITNASIVAAAGIAASKVVHQFSLDYAQAPGSDIATATLDLHICKAAGTIEAVEAAVTGVAATGDRSVTVDVQRSTGGAAFATVLSSAITLDSANALRTLEAGTVASPTNADGDILRIVVTQVAGTTGTRPQGLIVTVTVTENPS